MAAHQTMESTQSILAGAGRMRKCRHRQWMTMVLDNPGISKDYSMDHPWILGAPNPWMIPGSMDYPRILGVYNP